jgi:hypothetical protein
MKAIGRAAGFGVMAQGAGVEIGPANVWSPEEARRLAAFLIQAADEVERMRGERMEFVTPSGHEPRQFVATGKFTVPKPEDQQYILYGYGGGGGGPRTEDEGAVGNPHLDLSGNPRFERGG